MACVVLGHNPHWVNSVTACCIFNIFHGRFLARNLDVIDLNLDCSIYGQDASRFVAETTNETVFYVVSQNAYSPTSTLLYIAEE